MNTPVILLNVSVPVPDAGSWITLISVREIPLPSAPVESLAGAHSVPSHFSTWPAVGSLALTLGISERVVISLGIAVKV